MERLVACEGVPPRIPCAPMTRARLATYDRTSAGVMNFYGSTLLAVYRTSEGQSGRRLYAVALPANNQRWYQWLT